MDRQIASFELNNVYRIGQAIGGYLFKTAKVFHS